MAWIPGFCDLELLCQHKHCSEMEMTIAMKSVLGLHLFDGQLKFCLELLPVAACSNLLLLDRLGRVQPEERWSWESPLPILHPWMRSRATI